MRLKVLRCGCQFKTKEPPDIKIKKLNSYKTEHLFAEGFMIQLTGSQRVGPLGFHIYLFFLLLLTTINWFLLINILNMLPHTQV